MAPVEMYSIEYCPFCVRAKALLENKGIPYTDHDLSGYSDSDRRTTLKTLCKRTTVPQIWIGGRHIGGCTDLQTLDRTGELDRMIREIG